MRYLNVMRPAVILLSGGLDSAVVLAIARSLGFECYALTVNYGQRHEVELLAASRVAVSMGVKEHRVFSLPLSDFGGSSLTADIEVPKDQADAPGIPSTYVPARNTVFLSLALAYAETLNSADIFCGVNAVDYSGYPDCRPAFIASFQETARLATKAGVEGAEITIHAPLLMLKKAEIIQRGTDLGVDFGLTHSCYDPVGMEACGHCDSCLIRSRAFAELGLEDPVTRGDGGAGGDGSDVVTGHGLLGTENATS